MQSVHSGFTESARQPEGHIHCSIQCSSTLYFFPIHSHQHEGLDIHPEVYIF